MARKSSTIVAENFCKGLSRLELVSSEVLSVIATTVNPDGVVATAVRQPLQVNRI